MMVVLFTGLLLLCLAITQWFVINPVEMLVSFHLSRWFALALGLLLFSWLIKD